MAAEDLERRPQFDDDDDDSWDGSDDEHRDDAKDKPAAAVAVKDAPAPAAAAQPAEKVEKPVKLEGEDLKRAQFLQDTLKNLVPAYMEAKLTEEQQKLKPEERNDIIKKQMETLRDALKKEREEGVFGPATQEAYKQYVNWLQKAVPETIRELDSLGLALPPGSPIPLDSDRQGRAIDPQLYKALAADERLALQLKLEPGKLPTDAQLDKLDSVFNWLAKANESAADTRGKQRDSMLNKVMDENGLPQGWRKQPGDNPLTWRSSAEEMVDLAIRTRNYVEAMQSLFKASRNADFPIELPRGTKLTVEDSSGKRHEIDANQLVDSSVRSILKNGTIKEVKLDLPQDLRQEDPANREKIARLREWLSTHGEKIDQAVGELAKLQKNPDAVIMFGDQEVPNGKALLNAKGEFVALVSGKYTPKAGERVEDMNLIGYDFQVEQITEGENKGKYKITQTIQAEKAPWYAYQNIRAFGIDKVGQPMKVDEKIISADDFVPVRNGSKIELVKAKNLESFKNMQQTFYYGEKAIAITMDAAMLVSGTIEVGAAIKGARLAAVGAEAALKMGFREAAWEIGKGAVRVGVAGAGIFNNAGARDTEWGRTVNTARGIYFLADIGLGLASTGWNLFRAGKATEALTSAEKVHTIIRGREAVNGAEAIKGIPWIKQIHQGTEWAFKATELGFAPIIIADLKHQIHDLATMGQRDPAKDAVLQVGDGRGLQKAEKGAFDPNNEKSLKAARDVVDGYKDTLVRGRSEESAKQIKDILDKTKELLGPGVKEQDIAKFRQDLLAKMSFSGDQIKQLEAAHPEARNLKDFQLSTKDIHDLMDPEKRKNYPKAVAELAEKFMAEKDKDVLAAAEVALLYVSRDKDGNIKAELGKFELEVPEYKKKIWHPGEGESPGWEEEVTVKARNAEQSVSTAEVVRNLQRDLEDPKLGNRGIVTGEVLTRIGALTHQQYGGILTNVLKDPKASREDKLRALADSTGPRMAAVIDGVRYQESSATDTTSGLSKERAAGKAHGLTSEAMMAELEKTAKNDKEDSDVRAMAAALLYGLREKNQERRAELLSGFNTLLDQNRDKNGELAKKTSEFLKNELKADLPERPIELVDRVRETKLNAVLALAAITAKDDAAAQKELTQQIVMQFSPTNLELSSKVLDALMPERFEQMLKDDPRLANDLRVAAINMIKRPDTIPHEADMVKFLPKLEALLKDADVELKRQLQGKLQDLIRNSNLNPGYAKFFPSLRAAAIDSLANMGSRESLDLIRSHVSAQPSLKIGGKDVACAEEDAGVRMAAIRALEKLADPQLRNVINELVDKETDPTVASQMRDVKFTQQRIEPDSREWKDLYEKTRTDLIGFGKKYPYLDNFTHEQAKAWMKENFPLLDHETYMERAKSAVDNATDWWFRRTSFEVTIKFEEWKAVRDKNNERWGQWRSLVDMAQQGGEQGNKAKMALYYIATQSGSLMGANSGLDASAIKGYYNENHYHKIYEHDWKWMAARELRDLAKSNCEGKDVLAKMIKDGLTANKELRATESDFLLEGWRELGKPDRNGYAIPREELARVTAEALKLETRRLPGAQADYYQKSLIEDLKKYGHRMVLPVMQAMVDEPGHVKEDVRKQAQEMIDSFLHSTDLMYKDTKADATSTSAQRAERLKKALEDKNNAETTVQEIFSAYKDYKIKDANDPGLAQLQLAMNDTNERVRLAAAKILMNSELVNTHPVKMKAAATLADITLTGSNAAYHNEAYSMLCGLKLEDGKPLSIKSGNRYYRIEKAGDKVKATELTMPAGSDQLQPCGYIYPNGASFRFQKNAAGEITHIWDNGAQWQRQSASGKLTNQWTNPVTRGNWKGEYTLLENSEYKYQTEGDNKVHTRKPDGTWLSVQK